MSNLSSFMISFCSSCILLGFLYMLCPDGSMSKSVKYVFCLCFLCCVLSTVIGMPKIDLGDFSQTSKSDTVTEQSAATTAQLIFTEALTRSNINFAKIEIDTNKLSDGSITISRVTVYSTVPADQIIAAIGSDSYEVCVINE